MSDFVANEATQTVKSNSNPLSQYFRQPKIWIKLPSNGEYYPPGTIDRSTNGEYPVYAMTAKDELLFKTPDALLTGQTTVEIIKSCMPAILDPWKMPSIDVDCALIAIRLATYGENMDITVTCPSCDTTSDYEMNLRGWLETFENFKYQNTIAVDPLKVIIRPYSYQELSKAQLQTLEQQKLVDIATDDKLTDEEKMDKFGKGFVRLTEYTVNLISGCIARIETPTGPVSDQKMIKEFIDNAPSNVFDTIHKHITGIKEQVELKPQKVKCPECEHLFSTPIVMDQSNFFAVRS